LLDLVHRPVVEVGDPGVDAQEGLCDAQLVLAGRRLVVDERAGQDGFAVVPGRQLDRRLPVPVLRRAGRGTVLLQVGAADAGPDASGGAAAPWLCCGGAGAARCSSRWARRTPDRSVSSSIASRGRARTSVGVSARYVRGHSSSAARSTRSPKNRPSARMPASASPPYSPGRVSATLPCAMRWTAPAGRPLSAIVSPAAYSRCSNRPASAPRTSAPASPRSGGSSASSGGTTRTSAPSLTNVTRPSPSRYVSRRFTR